MVVVVVVMMIMVMMNYYDLTGLEERLNAGALK